MTYAKEFRYDGARQRYLARTFNASGTSFNWTPIETIWTDYDGDEPYGDWTMTGTNPATLTQLRSFELGLAVYETGSSTRYFRGDHLGTTRRMSNSSGVMTSSLTYTAFGEAVANSTAAAADRYRYVGAWGYQTDHDPDGAGPALSSPFLHVGHRYYDPASGRFLQRDPIGIRGGFAVYTYASSSPLRFVDPEGLFNDNSFAPPSQLPGASITAEGIIAVTGGNESWLDNPNTVGWVQWGLEGPSLLVGAPLAVFGKVPRLLQWALWCSGAGAWFF